MTGQMGKMQEEFEETRLSIFPIFHFSVMANPVFRRLLRS
ncbi:hypothetical protein B932_2882 [Gluconobacter oxydans H24]|nr:hypothetical protein B932_2882 [Gluconobacter oxydans H24]